MVDTNLVLLRHRHRHWDRPNMPDEKVKQCPYCGKPLSAREAYEADARRYWRYLVGFIPERLEPKEDERVWPYN